MANTEKINIGELIRALIIMGVGLGVVFGVSIALGRFKDQPAQIVPSELVKSIISCPTDFDSYIKTEKKLSLIQGRPSNGTNGSIKGYKVTIERTGLTSDIACGYLFYSVNFNNKPIEQEYMALFMRPTSSQFGGHILPDEKKGAIINVFTDGTQILMPLDIITYDGLSRNPIKEANWVSLLNVSQQMEFEVGLSADTQNGMIDDLQIAYKCINKETGRETNDCSLKVVKVEPTTI